MEEGYEFLMEVDVYHPGKGDPQYIRKESLGKLYGKAIGSITKFKLFEDHGYFSDDNWYDIKVFTPKFIDVFDFDTFNTEVEEVNASYVHHSGCTVYFHFPYNT